MQDGRESGTRKERKIQQAVPCNNEYREIQSTRRYGAQTSALSPDQTQLPKINTINSCAAIQLAKK